MGLLRFLDSLGFGRDVSDNNPLPVRVKSGDIVIDGPITISTEVEVKNDDGNPLPVKDTAGGDAATITTDTVAVTGSFVAITVLADAVFTSLTRANTTGTLGSITIPAGVTIFGAITGYQLASGAVIAYGA